MRRSVELVADVAKIIEAEREKEAIVFSGLEEALKKIKPFYTNQVGGSGAEFIKKFIDSLRNGEPVDLSRASCLDNSNSESLIIIFRAYTFYAGECLAKIEQKLIE